MKQTAIGILAHVDSGKTTLSEALLYCTGNLQKLGRVDHRDSFLDTYALERDRGITIFSKQAVLACDNARYYLLDTPGHVDFSAETERTLQVLDYAILVVSGTDGVQSHTKTLWRLLQKYRVPCFLFVNKMDLPGADKTRLLNNLKGALSDACIDFSDEGSDAFLENIALCDEDLLVKYEENAITDADMIDAIRRRRLFPCFFGSALKLEGVERFWQAVQRLTRMPAYGGDFGAKVYKIAEDNQGNRLTFLKVTGGVLRVKDVLPSPRNTSGEKVNQIRVYSGEKFTAVSEAAAGTVCAVTGVTFTRSGDGLGAEADSGLPVLEPVLTYRVALPPQVSAHTALAKMRILEAEDPQLNVVWDERHGDIQVQLMGEIQLEVLRSLIAERFGFDVTFGQGNIIYKETIADTVEGVGHFEPLRHYAEVHLLLKPAKRDSGLVFNTRCKEDLLDKNWQRLILTHLYEKTHLGVLTGSPITDMEISLVSGKAHAKHTEGGDFRQATYRAVRQGLRSAESILLEPVYDFVLEVPAETLGRA
ncbi:MAG: TetM/TetW/TetO/TetS family tetracycline resistance ribosomal protection protein, partial [Ruminococcus sp.]|nr:TetM/TetW/TetO/TetS family tetracycline resistance ribosomal protection protein [Ruminococcus sp.]